MAAKKVGELIKEGRTAKKLSQEQLASQIDGLSAGDISKAERGEKELSQAQLKAIAKVIGVTQKSLLEAPSGVKASTSKTSTSAKTASSSKTSTAKTSTAAKTTASKTSSTSKASTAKTSTASKTASTESLTSTEKKLVELYRTADSDRKKLATKLLKGDNLEVGDVLPLLMQNGTIGEDGLLGGLLGKVQNLMGK